MLIEIIIANDFLSPEARKLSRKKIEATDIVLGWINSTDNYLILDEWYKDLKFTDSDSFSSMKEKIDELDVPKKYNIETGPIYDIKAQHSGNLIRKLVFCY
jgi:hypothetical protein